MNRFTRSHLALSLLVLALGLLPAACGRGGGPAAAGRGKPAASPSAEAAGTAKPRPTADRGVDNVVTADGELVLPMPPQPLAFTAAGEVQSVDVVEGQSVQAGARLATVDPGPADLAIAQAQANVTQAQAALDKLERGASLTTGRMEIERAKNNLWAQQSQRDAVCGAADRKMAPQADCDAAQANVQAGEQAVKLSEANLAAAEANQPGDVSSARAQLAQARLALAQAREDRTRTELTAPFDGVVSQLAVIPGIRVAPGSPVLSLVKTRPLRFQTTNLGERNVGDIEPGSPATVTLTSFPDQPLKATVQRIAPQAAKDAGGLTVFTVTLDVEPEDLRLRAGMTGRAEIQVGH